MTKINSNSGGRLRARSGSTRNLHVRVSRRGFASFLVLNLLAMVIGGFVSSSSASQIATTHKTPTQVGLSFFRGKTLTLITGGAPGAFIYSWAQILTPVMGSYLHAQIDIVDINSGGSVGSENALAGSLPNGLTFGWMNLGAAVDLEAAAIPGMNFNPAALPYVGAVNGGASVFLAKPNSPYKTFADVLASTGVGFLDLVSGNYDFAMRGTFGAYRAKEKIITGYSSTPLLMTGFLRGDAPLTLINLSTADAALINGQARALFKTEDVPATDPAAGALRNVPTLEKFVTKNPPKVKNGKAIMKEVEQILDSPFAFAFPRGTPQSDVDAMGKAMAWAMSRPSVKKTALAISLVPQFISGPVAHKGLLAALKGDSLVKPYLAS